MARSLAVLFLLLVLGLAVLVLRFVPSAGEPESLPSTVESARVAEVASASRHTEAERAARVETRASTPAVPEQPQVPESSAWVEIRVVDKLSQRPVAGADVAWMDGTTSLRGKVPPEDLDWADNDKESMARTYGWRTRADAHGVARVSVTGYTTVFARDGTRSGKLQCDKNQPAPPGGHRIELVEDRFLLVQVLDATGTPATGVPIAVTRQGVDGASVRVGPLTRSARPDGIARILHIPDWLRRLSSSELLATQEWRVRPEVPGYTDPGVAFDPKAPPAEPVALHLPPSGRIAVCVEVRGRRAVGRFHIDLHGGTPKDQSVRSRAWMQAVGSDGQARFPWIPLGGTFTAFAGLSAIGKFRQEFAGPTAPGQEVTVVLAPSDDEIVLSGRVLDHEQQLVRDAALEVRLKADRFEGSANVHTDAEGRFLCFIGLPGSSSPRIERFTIHLRGKDGGVPRWGVLAPRDLRPGLQDLGDLVLGSSVALVAGRFLEGEKPYVNHVTYFVERMWADGGASPQGMWERVNDLTTAQGPDGAFHVRGAPEPGRYRLCFAARDHLPVAPVEFVPGTVDLEVQIARGAQLTASLLMPPAVPWGVLAELIPDSGDAEATGKDDPLRFRSDQRVAEPGEAESGRYRLQWRALTPGTYTLAIRLWGVAEPLVSIPGVSVPATEPDGRLQDIDLSDQVAVLSVRVVDATGRLLEDSRRGVVFLMPQDPASVWIGHQIRDGNVRMPIRPGPVDLLVASQGLRARELYGVRDPVRVTLETWPQLDLVFPDLPELPERYSLHVELSSRRLRGVGGYATPWFSSAALDELFRPPLTSKEVQDGRVSVPIGDGVHWLSVVLRDASGSGRPVEDVTPREVSAGEGPIEVRVPAESMRKAIEERQKAGTGR